MKQNIIFFLFFVTFSFKSIGQVNFTNLSFDEALNAAQQNGKLIFLQFEALNCIQCNEVANKAFEDLKLGEFINSTFVPVKITSEHPDRNRIANLYNKTEKSFGTLFIAPDGTLLHDFPKTISTAKRYQEEIDKALNKGSEGFRISTLQSEFDKGNRNLLFLEDFMLAKKSLNLETDTLLEIYTSQLPEDSLRSIRTLLFIAKMAPLIKSKPDAALRKYYNIFITAWNSQPSEKRISINALIVYKSMSKAIKEKNETYAYQVANFRRSTYDKDYRNGQKAFEKEMIRYYLETDDTLNYLKKSVYYYDNYLMTISVDSIIRIDSNRRKAQFDNAALTTGENGSYRKIISYTPISQFYCKELTNAAHEFYEMTNEPVYISKALQWAERANEFFTNHTTMNTYALLLNKAGKTTEAKAWKIKAIENKKKLGYDTKILEKELEEMR